MSNYNEVVTCIINDLGLHWRSASIPDSVYLRQVLYSAMSEWIRVITLDVDPLNGSNKIGVTYDYLEDRSSSVMEALSQAITGNRASRQEAKEATTFMISAMLFAGELWETADHNIICATKQLAPGFSKHDRVLGIRGQIGDTFQVGIARYTRATQGLKDENSMLAAERELVSIQPELSSTLGHSRNDCLSELQRRYKSHIGKDSITISSIPAELPPYLKKFLFLNGWPWIESGFNWDKTDTWYVRVM